MPHLAIIVSLFAGNLLLAAASNEEGLSKTKRNADEYSEKYDQLIKEVKGRTPGTSGLTSLTNSMPGGDQAERDSTACKRSAEETSNAQQSSSYGGEYGEKIKKGMEGLKNTMGGYANAWPGSSGSTGAATRKRSAEETSNAQQSSSYGGEYGEKIKKGMEGLKNTMGGYANAWPGSSGSTGAATRKRSAEETSNAQQSSSYGGEYGEKIKKGMEGLKNTMGGYANSWPGSSGSTGAATRKRSAEETSNAQQSSSYGGEYGEKIKKGMEGLKNTMGGYANAWPGSSGSTRAATRKRSAEETSNAQQSSSYGGEYGEKIKKGMEGLKNTMGGYANAWPGSSGITGAATRKRSAEETSNAQQSSSYGGEYGEKIKKGMEGLKNTMGGYANAWPGSSGSTGAATRKRSAEETSNAQQSSSYGGEYGEKIKKGMEGLKNTMGGYANAWPGSSGITGAATRKRSAEKTSNAQQSSSYGGEYGEKIKKGMEGLKNTMGGYANAWPGSSGSTGAATRKRSAEETSNAQQSSSYGGEYGEKIKKGMEGLKNTMGGYANAWPGSSGSTGAATRKRSAEETSNAQQLSSYGGEYGEKIKKGMEGLKNTMGGYANAWPGSSGSTGAATRKRSAEETSNAQQSSSYGGEYGEKIKKGMEGLKNTMGGYANAWPGSSGSTGTAAA